MVTTKNNGQNGRSLPEGWEWMELGNLVSFVGSGVTPKGGKNVYLKEGIPFIRSQNVYPDGLRLEDVAYVTKELHAEMNRTHIRAGDVLLNITGASIGRSTFVPESLGEANVNQHVCILRPLNIITPKFLSAFLNSNNGQDQIMEAQSGVTRQGLNYTQVRALQIPVPPLPEQERIVNRIEELFSDLEAGVAALERSRAGLRRYKASVLKAAVEGKLVSQNATEEPADELLRRILAKKKKKAFEPETEDLPTLPKGWVWATADQLSESERSITYGVVKLGDEVDDGVPTLRSSNVRHLLLEPDGVKRISPSIASQYKRTKLEGGEILITVRGTLGGVVVAPEEVTGWNISREVAMIALVDKQIGRLLQYFIASVPLQNWLSRHTRGIAYIGINIETLKQLPIPLPPLDEQRRIVAEVERRLSVVGEVESAVDAGLVRAGRLRQSVLRSAFEGRL